ncbi:conjugative transfer ATPase [Pasteurella testudinis]|uniref:conjugative transfer ATPase n=1 Tax=Pasteurella testudinis TaxID=761 RepID=UPI004059C425
MRLNLFKSKKDTISPLISTNHCDEAEHGYVRSNEINFVKRNAYLMKTHQQAQKQESSFVSRLPWVEFIDDQQVMLLEDGRSLGAVFEIKPNGTEGRSVEYLESIRTQIKDALQDAFDELDNNPWVVQFFCQDDEMAASYRDVLEHYIQPNAKGTVFSDAWLNLMEKHLNDISKPGGLFVDKMVTNTPWRGQIRRTRMVVYRYVSAKSNETLSPLEALNNACERIVNSLQSAGLYIERQAGKQIHEWLLRWFNPAPDMFESAEHFYQQCSYPEQPTDPNDLMIWEDFSETLLVKSPQTKGEYWLFDEKPHEVVVVDSIRRAPPVGLITGEIKRGDNFNALFDLLPEGTVMSSTMVVYPQDLLERHLATISSKAKGDNVDSVYAKQDCDRVQAFLKEKHKMYHSALAFYVKGEDERDLRAKSRRLRSALLSSGLVPVAEGNEVAPLNSYLRWLPMSFNPQDDRNHLYTKFNFVQHIANLIPVFGRSTGTGHPGITYFNRGGAPLDFDPLSKLDRTKNAHTLILGPTGAGKSATLNGKIAQLMAVHRPRLFVIEAGNSFGLMAEYAATLGLTVNKVTLKPGSGVTLPLFADCHRLMNDPKVKHRLSESAVEAEEREEQTEEAEQEGDDQRDILGEMEITARLMITGGEAKEDERLSRPDKAMIRKAIILAAEKTYQEKRQTLTQDVRDAFYTISQDESLPEKSRERAYEMGESLGMFCQPGSFEAELFNIEGEAWPDADITLVDLATFAREGYESQLAIAYISLINHINSLGEKYQYSGRPIVNITDEAHIITVNALLARFLTKGSKMWRKLGIWLWLATQNMKDFPKDAVKLINMLEWWELLCGVDDYEISEICRFKPLTEEQKTLIRSAKKDRNYTEGVVLSDKLEALFRVVPPSLYLALAMTEPEEKAERMTLMKKFAISELEAAMHVAARIDKGRGIEPCLKQAA